AAGSGSPPLPPTAGFPLPGHGSAPGPPPHQELPPETPAEPPPSAQGSPPGGSRSHARLLASRLFRLDGVRRSEVAAFLRRGDGFSAMVAQEYLEWFQFGGQELDQALRSFLRALALSGETQERERVLGHFSRRFHSCNPGAFPSPDAVHSLTCALMLLNTDLHGQRLGRPMSSAQFVANLRGMMDGEDFPGSSSRLSTAPSAGWAGGGGPPRPQEQRIPAGAAGGGRGRHPPGLLGQEGAGRGRGQKGAVGQTRLEALRGGAGGDPPAAAQGGGPPEAPLGVHHALAERAPAYTKRPDVFRLRAADGSRFLFQAPTPREMLAWIERLNLAAALLSAPPFPAAVGSQRGPARPLLPAALSRSPPEEQRRSHAAWMERVERELRQQRAWQHRGRGGTDIALAPALRDLRAGAGLVAPRPGRAGRGGGGGAGSGPRAPPALSRARSSPSLGPGPAAAPPARVRRNESERGTLRSLVGRRLRERP
ncbi:PH and SEC7 domain-containing protein 4-like, partial [Pezoporus wallicus]|uniref:PH and SEC7 domain-containing protein 4-like n=1 Tax=Pezoporus wallicus TaxID=35540 RepID=UPI002550A4B6